MILYFVRHGRAEDRADWPPANVHLRPLTEDGIQDMRTRRRPPSASWGSRPTAILTSPLVRARQTAEIIAEGAGHGGRGKTPRSKPGFGVGPVDRPLDAHPGAESLLLVGHERDLCIVVQDVVRRRAGGRSRKGSLNPGRPVRDPAPGRDPGVEHSAAGADAVESGQRSAFCGQPKAEMRGARAWEVLLGVLCCVIRPILWIFDAVLMNRGPSCGIIEGVGWP